MSIASASLPAGFTLSRPENRWFQKSPGVLGEGSKTGKSQGLSNIIEIDQPSVPGGLGSPVKVRADIWLHEDNQCGHLHIGDYALHNDA